VTDASIATAPAARQPHAADRVFSIEETERGQADVGHFFFANNEAMIGLVIGRRHRRP
jgi:hypothetical protein